MCSLEYKRDGFSHLTCLAGVGSIDPPEKFTYIHIVMFGVLSQH